MVEALIRGGNLNNNIGFRYAQSGQLFYAIQRVLAVVGPSRRFGPFRIATGRFSRPLMGKFVSRQAAGNGISRKCSGLNLTLKIGFLG